ncbi:MAG TPA: pyridoxal phosphate-dependent aminotransferase [bacterium]|nr:pyridoxal phosphate-dependent aminotransferase [bacterium]
MIPRHIQKIKSFLAMDILERLEERRAAGRPTISFSLGEPDLQPPDSVRRACVAALEQDFTKYTSTQGLPELREAIARDYQRKYGVAVDPDQILVTGGTSPALLLTFSVLLETGDDVIVSNPHYPCYPAFVEYLKGKANYVKVHEEDGFQYRPEEIRKKIGPKTKAILVNSPSNPTGTLLPEDSMKAIADLADKDRWIISDEIYHNLVYEGRERSILEFTDKAFVLNGFSKSYAMTGYRLGYVIAPKPFIRTMRILHQNFYISANSFVQKAGVAALQEGGEYLKKVRRTFDERRKAMLEGVERLGFKVAVRPTGAFYVFANAKHLTQDSYKFALDLLEQTDVGVTPGIDFGSGGEGYLRFSYATSVERIREGIDRIARYLGA